MDFEIGNSFPFFQRLEGVIPLAWLPLLLSEHLERSHLVKSSISFGKFSFSSDFASFPSLFSSGALHMTSFGAFPRVLFSVFSTFFCLSASFWMFSDPFSGTPNFSFSQSPLRLNRPLSYEFQLWYFCDSGFSYNSFLLF